MSILSNFLQAMSSGAASHFAEKDANRRESKRYKKVRSRALEDEKERRARSLKYNEEDYGIQQRRKGDEQEQLIDAAKAVSKQVGDPDYVNQAIVKAFGLPSLPDKTNQAIKQKQLEYWTNRNSAALRSSEDSAGTSGRGFGQTGGKGQMKDLLETYKVLEAQLKNSYEFDTTQGQFVSRLLPQEERDLREAMRNVLYQIDSITRGQNTGNADGSNPLLKIIEEGKKVFGMGEDNPVEPDMPQKPGSKDAPEKSIQVPDFSPMSPAMSPAIINPDKPDYRPLVGGINYDRNAPIYKFLRDILTLSSKPKEIQGRQGNTSGVFNGFGFGPGRNY